MAGIASGEMRLKTDGKSRWPLIVGIVVAALILIVIITPFLIDVNRFRPEIEQAIGEKIGRKVQIGNLKASLFSGSLEADQITIGDDAAFSHDPFLTAKSLSVGVEMKPLIFSREVRVHTITIDAPELQLLRTAEGRWNFSSLGANAGAAQAPADASGSSPVKSFSVEELKIKNAEISIGRVGAAASSGPKRVAYQSVNISVKNFSETEKFPFTFDAKTPGGGKMNVNAQLGPIGNADAEHMPFDGKLNADAVPATDIENMLSVLGYSLPDGSSLQGGTLQADVSITGPLARMVIAGPVELDGVKLSGFSLTSKLAGGLGSGGDTGANETVIQKAAAKARYAPDGLRADDLDVEIPSIGSVTGSGTVAPDNALHFELAAKLNASSPLGALTKIPGLAQIAGTQNGAIPFRVEGTTSKPVVTPELKSPIKGAAGAATAVGTLGGLLGKKKTHP